jgi:hypothetical protein
MKILILTLIAILGMTTITSAAKPEKFTLRPGQQKRAAGGELRIKFVSVVEDSRCPVGVDCIWAGNAQIKVIATDERGEKKEMTMNTTMGPQGDQFAGYAINLVSLTPVPTAKGKAASSRYRATFTVARLYR